MAHAHRSPFFDTALIQRMEVADADDGIMGGSDVADGTATTALT